MKPSTEMISTPTSAAHRARMIVAGTPVDLRERRDVLTEIQERLAGEGVPLAVGSVNLDHVHHFGGIEKEHHHIDTTQSDLEWMLLADGMPIVDRAAKLTDRRWPRITGADLLPDILSLASTHGSSVAFLGGTTEAHGSLRRYLHGRLPDLTVTGSWSPTRSDIETDSMGEKLATQIAATHPDILVVGLGKPRQELWIDRFGVTTGARVLLAFGAAADFLAGTAKRAPKWIGDHGFEWAYRLAHEPSRLAHRYLVDGPDAWMRLHGAYLVADSAAEAPSTTVASS